MRKIQRSIKYLFDRVFSVIILILVFPLLIVIALSIKIDDGNSVFFCQARLGLNCFPFKIWKFRTMVPNADNLLNYSGQVGNVNRITRVGRFLRFTSLDELPQLFNIIRGEMSFIGPRPTLPEHYDRYTEEQKKRFRMKPGVTGLAQINGRNTLEWSKRIQFDNMYIDKYSLLLDLTVLFKTIKVVFFREGIVLDRNPDQVDDLGK